MKGAHPLVAAYAAATRTKAVVFLFLLAGLVILAVTALAVGPYAMSPNDVVRALLGRAPERLEVVVWNIRMPRVVAAVAAGWALGVSGAVMQCLLKNPLASPFTLGISHAAAFGAAFALVVLGAGAGQAGALRTTSGALESIQKLYSVTTCAFLGAMAATLVVLFLARVKKLAPEAIVLAGVALSSLFMAGTIFVQYFATEVEVAAIVFWTFGDVARSNWGEIGIMTGATVLATAYFVASRWDLNAISAGDDVAHGLGVNVERVRLYGMFAAALVCALVVAFHGVIAFLGLLAPHIARRVAGGDYRVLVPFSCVVGAVLLLAADTVGRVLVGSGTLPVGVLTSFMGAPLFLCLLVGGDRRWS